VIEPLDLSVTKAAEILGVTRPALSALLNGHAALSPEIALRIEKAFGPKTDTLLRMQTAYEIAETRENKGTIKVKRYIGETRSDSFFVTSPKLPPPLPLQERIRQAVEIRQ
jgi:antitoxin HigA-1